LISKVSSNAEVSNDCENKAGTNKRPKYIALKNLLNFTLFFLKAGWVLRIVLDKLKVYYRPILKIPNNMSGKTYRKILITGVAGFIGFHVAKKLIEKKLDILGVDSINNYYSTKLKNDRLKRLNSKNFKFLKGNINNKNTLNEIQKFSPNIIIHLGAQAGVRYSIDNPMNYVENNIKATLRLFEISKHNKNLKHFIYASTSSVYGLSEDYPLSEAQGANHPIQFYAVTKKTTELMAHSYSALFNIPTTGLRFFTVYGPWGRPDMALYKFTKNILSGNEIEVFGHGKHIRDFTYIDDIVNGIQMIMNKPPSKNTSLELRNLPSHKSIYPFRLLNIGGGKPTNLMDYINEIELNLGKKANIKFMDIQPGDKLKTESDLRNIKDFGYIAKTPINKGIKEFVSWYLDYYK
jgi:UDP-glucuronate 4-epimerase